MSEPTKEQKRWLDIIKNESHKIGHLAGFKKLTPLHHEWIKKMLMNKGTYVLKAHRGSYKSTCIEVFFALKMVLCPNETMIFVRKTDDDVKEVIEKVKSLLQTPVFQELVRVLYNTKLEFKRATAFEIDTNLHKELGGGSQLLAIGLKGSITGKHADGIIVDDICFVGGTQIATPLGDRNIEDLKVGDLVLTPLGYKKIKKTTNRKAEVITNIGLTGTYNHPIYNFGKNTLDFLVNMSYNDCSSLGLKELLQWKIAEILLNGMVENGNEQVENIISCGQIIKTGLAKCCIEQYGKNIMVKFPKAMTFIIKTIIQVIMTLTTWSVYQVANTINCTCKTLIDLNNQRKTCEKKQDQLYENGKNLKRVKLVLKKWENTCKKKAYNVLLKLNAKSVVQHLECTPQQERVCVELVENEQTQENKKKKENWKDKLIQNTLKLFVPNVENHIEHKLHKEIKTDCAKIVPQENVIENENYQTVYNLEIEDVHYYYANGILVHNCNTKDRESRSERELTKRVWFELNSNIKNPNGWVISTGTTWHPDDVFSVMPPAEIYTCYDTGLLTDEQIQVIKDNMPPALFAANYELRFVASDDCMFTTPNMVDEKDYYDEENKVTYLDMISHGLCHVDAGYGGGDYTAFTIMKKIPDKEDYLVLGKCWRRHVNDCIAEIESLIKKYKCGTLYLENNGDKGYLAREFKYRGIRVASYHERLNKHTKICTYAYRIWKKLKWLKQTDENYIGQVLDYTEMAEHDDCIDSLASLSYRFLASGKVVAVKGINI